MTNILQNSDSKIKFFNSIATDVKDISIDISKFDPDVVLLEESMTKENTDMVPRFLMTYPNIRFIVISNDSNWLHIYRNKEMLITHPRDLLSSITSD
jgi:hypothetical protein